MRAEISNDGTWVIEFEVGTETFYLSQIDKGNKQIYGSYDSYANAQKAIDRTETIKKKKITPLPFIKTYGYKDEYEKGKITSIAEVRSYGVNVWVSINKSRSKESSSSGLLKDTIENEDILKRITQLRKTINEESLKLTKWTDDELKKHFGES